MSATDRHAPSLLQRPVESGPSLGLVGVLLQASRAPHATNAITNTRNEHRRMTPYNPDRSRIKARHGDQVWSRHLGFAPLKFGDTLPA